MSDRKIVQFVADHGVDKVRFTIPTQPLRRIFNMIAFTSSEDDPVQCECKIREDRYKVSDNYKIILQPLDEKYAYESFYIMDLESLMERQPDKYKMFTVG